MLTTDSATLAVGGDERTVRVFGREIPRALFFVRLFYLLYFAAFGSLFPLLAVYFKQLGMTAMQAGLLLGSRPLVEFTASPFWGGFSERFRRSKALLLFSLAAMVVFMLAIGFVQPVTPYCVVLAADRNKTLARNKAISAAKATVGKGGGGVPKINPQCTGVRLDSALHRFLWIFFSRTKLPGDMWLVPAGEIIRGGALGYLKQAAGFGRRKRETGNGRVGLLCFQRRLFLSFSAPRQNNRLLHLRRRRYGSR